MFAFSFEPFRAKAIRVQPTDRAVKVWQRPGSAARQAHLFFIAVAPTWVRGHRNRSARLLKQLTKEQGIEQPISEDANTLEQGEEMATPEQQQQLESLYNMGIDIIHGEGQVGDQIANMVLEAQDVSVGIGSAASALLIAIEKKAGNVPDEIKLQLAQELIAELTGLAVEAGALAEDEVNDVFIDAVASHAYSSYVSTKESMGELDPKELERAVQEAEGMTDTSVRRNAAPQAQQSESPASGGLMSMAGG